jgi:hypothetical protein
MRAMLSLYDEWKFLQNCGYGRCLSQGGEAVLMLHLAARYRQDAAHGVDGGLIQWRVCRDSWPPGLIQTYAESGGCRMLANWRFHAGVRLKGGAYSYA